MPIFPNPTSIAINNPVLGYGPTVQEIGPMSTELAIWLRARLELHQLRQQTKNLEYLNERELTFQSQPNREWDFRCRLAGTRSYATPLCDESGNLTSLGVTLGEKIYEHFLANLEAMQNDPRVTDWDLWTKTEDVFLMGQITIRQASMLKVLLEAIDEAERTNRLELDEAFQNAAKVERLTEQANIKAAKELVEAGKARGFGDVVNMFAERQVFSQPQVFQAKVFGYAPITMNPNETDETDETDESMPTHKRVAFVPTAMFGQRARSDLKNLVKYGLVDMKAYITGVRGRPKHLVRVSTPGSIVVKDLATRGII